MKVQLNLHLKLSIPVNFKAKKKLLTRSMYAQEPSTDAYKELLHDAIVSPTAESSLRPKSRQLSDIFSTSICEDLRPGCMRWQIWRINCWLYEVESQ